MDDAKPTKNVRLIKHVIKIYEIINERFPHARLANNRMQLYCAKPFNIIILTNTNNFKKNS